MTAKQVRYSKHAQKRMRERKIRRVEVRWVLARGMVVEVRADQYGTGEKRHGKEGRVRGKGLKVVFIERAIAKLVITVMWVA